MERKEEKEILKVALIGYGYWGKIMYKYLLSNPFIELVKICTKSMDEKDIFTENIDDILLDDNIEILFICTPIDTHYDICKRGLEAGKHIFCEKPATKEEGQLEELWRISENKGKILYIDYIYTVSPSIRKMKEILNECGEIYLVKGEISQLGKFYPNDTVYDVIGVHVFSVIAYLFNNIKILDYQVEGIKDLYGTQGHVSLKLENNIKIEVELNLLHPKKIRLFSIYGSNGSILFDMMDETTLYLCKYEYEGEKYVVLEKKEWSFNEFDNLEWVIHDFISCIQRGESTQNKMISTVVDQMLMKIDRNDIDAIL